VVDVSFVGWAAAAGDFHISSPQGPIITSTAAALYLASAIYGS
jgi:hypothetical protein